MPASSQLPLPPQFCPGLLLVSLPAYAPAASLSPATARLLVVAVTLEAFVARLIEIILFLSQMSGLSELLVPADRVSRRTVIAIVIVVVVVAVVVGLRLRLLLAAGAAGSLIVGIIVVVVGGGRGVVGGGCCASRGRGDNDLGAAGDHHEILQSDCAAE
jgi:hypothetical protein